MAKVIGYDPIRITLVSETIVYSTILTFVETDEGDERNDYRLMDLMGLVKLLLKNSEDKVSIREMGDIPETRLDRYYYNYIPNRK